MKKQNLKTQLLNGNDEKLPKSEIVTERRCHVWEWTPAEIAINSAIQIVETIGADVRLTDAVILLAQAQNKVADFVDDAEQSDS